MESFSKRRILVRLLKSHKTLILDLQSDDKGSNVPIRVVLARHHRIHRHKRPHAQHRTLNRIALMRFAVQQVYLPPQKRQPLASRIDRLPPPTGKAAEACLGAIVAQLSDHHKLSARRLARWQTRQRPRRFITAIALENSGHHAIKLRPDKLGGNSEAVTVYPRQTLAPGHAHSKTTSRTTLFLITRAPMNSALCKNKESDA
jgi:hypothetical protein